jgi:hypothetical protein
MRLATWIVALLDMAVFLFAVSVTFFSGSDAATKGLDNAAGWGIVALFAITVAPALVLLWHGKAPRTALALVLAPPVVIAVGVAAIVATLP